MGKEVIINEGVAFGKGRRIQTRFFFKKHFKFYCRIEKVM
jgi:hypothetical protein